MLASPSLSRGESCEFVFARDEYLYQKYLSYVLTNLLFSLSKSMWVIDLLVTFPSPYPRALAHPFTLKMLQAK